MRYNKELAKQIHWLDRAVLLQKELDLLLHKKRSLEKQLIFHWDDELKQQQWKEKILHIEKEIERLQQETEESKDLVNNLHYLIVSYMNLYQVSVPGVARYTKVPSTEIEAYLNTGIPSEQNKPFLSWAIRNFRLDMNRYMDILYLC